MSAWAYGQAPASTPAAGWLARLAWLQVHSYRRGWTTASSPEAELRGLPARDLSGKRYVYIWADGLHVNVRLDEERSCILVIMRADEHGTKELVAVSDGYRESTTSWREMLLDLRRRGLLAGPRLATADGALGFWKALREVYAGTREQICWFHKAGNLLDKMPKSVQSKAKTMIREMWQAPSLEEATGAYDQSCQAWATKYPKAVDCLRKDEQSLFSFYAFPAAHWVHLRTSNPIRVDLRHGAAADQADEGMRVAHRDPDDGVEVGVGGPRRPGAD